MKKMLHLKPDLSTRFGLWGALLVFFSPLSVAAPTFTLAQSPLFLSPGVNPNILVMLDNSESMDATMAGKVISGNDPGTRSNIARSVLRDVITTHRFSFNWGLGSFAISGVPELFTTYGYFMGTDATMVYTKSCEGIVDGVGTSPSNGGLRCVANPQTANGFGYITFSRSGDDPDINDVLYFNDVGPQLYGIGKVGSCVFFGTDYGENRCFHLYEDRDATTNWDGPVSASFSGTGTLTDGDPAVPFVATDAGFLPNSANFRRQILIRRGWGYGNSITGLGVINEDVVTSQVSTAEEVAAEATHNAQLMDLLAAEDANPVSVNIKNAAFFTPLSGTLETARNYFSGAAGTSPIQGSCQSNFVVLATDGNPTGKKDGTQYDPTQWVNSFDETTETWTFGPAVNDVFNEISMLRATDVSGTPFDVKTYVIGLGEGLVNESSVAALNEMANKGGTNVAYLADNPDALAAAVDSVVTSIQASIGSGAAVAASSQRFVPGLALYQATFNSVDWSGNLRALPVSADGSVGAAAIWEAATQLDQKNWDTGRSIISYKPSAVPGELGVGIAFRWPLDESAPTDDELNTSQVAALNKDALGNTDSLGAKRLEYLRGDTSNEIRNCAACTPSFRNRATTVLGDIVNSAPIYVGPPSAGFLNDFESVAYSSFTSAHSGRTPYVYVGANDGMLHAFDALTGVEKFAYVPNLVFDSLSKLTTPAYSHLYTVDGSPSVGDAFYGDAWHTVLVSGLRAGGKGLFALDVTDPSSATDIEASASSIVRWELSDPDLGHVFAQSVPLKTNNGKWSVIAGNGYGSPNGSAVLFVIDVETGLATKIDTGQGSPASPNGLSAPAVIDIDGNGIVDVAYAGDLNGNLWRFDLLSSSSASWSVAGGVPLFATGVMSKAITGKPDVARHPDGGYMVIFGTGQYLATTDISNTAVQTAYGIWDKEKEDGATVALTDLQQQTIVGEVDLGENTFRKSTHSVGAAQDSAVIGDNAIAKPTFFSTKRGWFVDLPTSGERIVADSQVRGGRAIFTSLIPEVGCNISGSGWVLEFDLYTGNRFGSAVFDTNNDGIFNTGDYLDSISLSGRKVKGGAPVGSTVTEFSDGRDTDGDGDGDGPCIEIRNIVTSTGEIVQVAEPCSSRRSARAMWRVVQ